MPLAVTMYNAAGASFMRTSTRPITAEELLRMPEDGFQYELVKGRLVQLMLPGAEHGIIEVRLCVALADHVERHDLGLVVAGDTGFKLESDPDTVRGPDVAFVRAGRVPPTGIPKGFWDGAPDLAVEILSPSNTASQIKEKLAEYLGLGSSQVWVVDPRRKTTTIHQRDAAPQVLGEEDQIDGGDLLPGFRYPVARLFAGLQQPATKPESRIPTPESRQNRSR
ncbi:MAG: Uma2 family endonuclease [Vicinamibacterales bacterium]